MARHPQEIRWLRSEINSFLSEVASEVARLRPLAQLGALPDFGSRLMVELAICTVAADRTLRGSDLNHQSARRIGRHRVVRLSQAACTFALAGAPRHTRPRKAIAVEHPGLLIFPFRPVGLPGYAARVFRDGEDIHTHFTHCPPQSFARRIADETVDPEALAGFANSWCQYDWPGADLIAADGHRGHYVRRRTLSAGDAVCDMCWVAQARRESNESGNADSE